MTEGGPPPTPYKPRRTFSELSGKGHRDGSSRARIWTLLAWSPVGALLGFLLGVRANIESGGGAPLIVATTVIGWAAVFFGPQVLLKFGGSFITSIYNPRGKRVPYKHQYSQAESLVVRGMYREAIDQFELAAVEEPEVPEPYLRVARIYRDNLEQYEDAIRWFKRARRECDMSPAMKLLVTREIVELYVTKLGEAKRALPELARLADEEEGTPEGDWAALELRRLKHGDAPQGDGLLGSGDAVGPEGGTASDDDGEERAGDDGETD